MNHIISYAIKFKCFSSCNIIDNSFLKVLRFKGFVNVFFFKYPIFWICIIFNIFKLGNLLLIWSTSFIKLRLAPLISCLCSWQSYTSLSVLSKKDFGVSNKYCVPSYSSWYYKLFFTDTVYFANEYIYLKILITLEVKH